MLTAEAFNAFLKTLEEPPPRVVFVLATTEPERIPATILSRCQRFDFHRLSAETMAKRLEQVAAAEELALEPRTAILLARTAEGSMRDGLGLLDQCISFCGTTINHEDVLQLLGVPASEILTALLGAIGQGDAGTVLSTLAELRSQGKDPRLLQKHFTFWLRNLLLIKVCREPASLLSLSKEEMAGLTEQAAVWSEGRMAAALTALTEQESLMRYAAQPWIVLEAILVGLCLPSSGDSLQEQAVDVTAAKQTPAVADKKPAASKAAKRRAPKISAAGGEIATTPAKVPTRDEQGLQADIKSAWNRILEEIKAKSPALEAVWRYGRPEAVQGNILQVLFETEGIKNVAAGPDKVAALEEALQKVLKTELKVRLDSAPASAAERRTMAVEPAVEEPPGIIEARTLFGDDKVFIREKSEEW